MCTRFYRILSDNIILPLFKLVGGVWMTAHHSWCYYKLWPLLNPCTPKLALFMTLSFINPVHRSFFNFCTARTLIYWFFEGHCQCFCIPARARYHMKTILFKFQEKCFHLHLQFPVILPIIIIINLPERSLGFSICLLTRWPGGYQKYLENDFKVSSCWCH